MKVLSTTSLTKLIELIKSSFLSVDNVVTTQTISCPADSEVVHNTGDETIAGIKTFSSTISGNINGNAATVTNGVYTTGNQTIAGTKTFSSTITGDISGNAATVTNGVYTTGNQTIAGNKTFSGTTSVVTPAVSDNSTKPVTTAYIETKFKVVSTLPTSPDTNTFYFIPE